MTELSHQQVNMERFDKLAADWDDNPMRTGIARAVTAAISNSIPLRRNMSVLDYGCGTGLVAFALAPRVKQLVAADSSAGMLNRVRKKIGELAVENIAPAQVDLSTEKHLDQQFDLIYTSMTMHHIPDTGAMISEFYQRLTPGGYLAIIDLDSEDGSFHGDMPGIAHQGFDRSSLKKLAEENGLHNVEIHTAHTVTRDTAQGKKKFDLFILTGERPALSP